MFGSASSPEGLVGLALLEVFSVDAFSGLGKETLAQPRPSLQLSVDHSYESEVGIDEISSRPGHDYVSLFMDLDDPAWCCHEDWAAATIGRCCP